MSDVVVAEVSALSPCAVLSRSDIAAVLAFEADKQLLGCDSDSCLAELANALGADELLTGTVTRIDGSVLLSLRLTDMKTMQVRRRVSDSQVGDDAAAISFVAWAARRLVSDDPQVIGPRPLPTSKQSIWRPLFWTSVGLAAAAGVVTVAAGITTQWMSDETLRLKRDGGDAAAIQQLSERGPVAADIANAGLYTTAGLVAIATILFFLPAEASSAQ